MSKIVNKIFGISEESDSDDDDDSDELSFDTKDDIDEETKKMIAEKNRESELEYLTNYFITIPERNLAKLQKKLDKEFNKSK